MPQRINLNRHLRRNIFFLEMLNKATSIEDLIRQSQESIEDLKNEKKLATTKNQKQYINHQTGDLRLLVQQL